MYHYHHLTLFEREKIFYCVAKSYTVSQITMMLKSNKSTVSRKLRRNGSSREWPIFQISIFKKTFMKWIVVPGNVWGIKYRMRFTIQKRCIWLDNSPQHIWLIMIWIVIRHNIGGGSGVGSVILHLKITEIFYFKGDVVYETNQIKSKRI